MTALRFCFRQAGGDTHVRVFAGGEGTTLAPCGELVFRNPTWEAFREVLHAADRVGACPEVAIEVVPDGDDHGDRH